MKRLSIFIVLAVVASFVIFSFPVSSEDVGVKGASIYFPEPVFDFGTVWQGEEVTHAFKFQNIGTRTLEIKQVQASCGCSKAQATVKKIAPGEFGEIEVTFRTDGFEGQQSNSSMSNQMTL
jgi:hypothetical protein